MYDQETDTSEDLLYKVWRLYFCYCLRHGFTERAMSLLQELLEEPHWQYRFTKFIDFVEAPYREGGLGTTFSRLRELAQENPDLDELLSLSAIQVICPRI